MGVESHYSKRERRSRGNGNSEACQVWRKGENKISILEGRLSEQA